MLLSIILLSISSCAPAGRDAADEQALYALDSVTWPSPTINVCWETPGFGAQKSWIHSFLTTPGNNTWMDYSPIRFNFLQDCTGTPSDTVHLCFTTDPGESVTYGGLGTATAGKFCGNHNGGIVFGDGSCALPGGNEQTCLDNAAIHEFGHMLGFAHDNNRPDRQCGSPQGTNGNETGGVPDSCSIMSYCLAWPCPNAGDVNHPSTLSEGDKEGVQSVYGYAPLFEMNSSIHFPADAAVTAVARTSTHLDVFAVGFDGGVYTNWWDLNANNAQWHGWFLIGGTAGIAPPGSKVTVLDRYPTHLDLFVVGNNGFIRTAWWDQNFANAQWQAWMTIGTHPFPAGTPVSVIARYPDNIYIFATGFDGNIWTAWWQLGLNNTLFSDVWPLPTQMTFPLRTEVAVASTDQNHVAAFAIGNDGNLFLNEWNNTNQWGTFTRVLFPGVQPAAWVGSTMAAVPHDPYSIDLAVPMSDHKIYHSLWHRNTGPEPLVDLGGAQAQSTMSLGNTGAPKVTMSWLKSNHLEFYVVGDDGYIYDNWFSPSLNKSAAGTPQFNGWTHIGVLPVNFSGGARPWVTPVNRFPGHMDIFTGNANYQAMVSWYDFICPLTTGCP